MKRFEISELKSDEIKEAARVFLKGLKMENPPGISGREKEILKLLRKDLKERIKKPESTSLVFKREGIEGLILAHRESCIVIDFIVSLNPGEGVGTRLIQKLTEHLPPSALIKTEISELDERVKYFYLKKLEFEVLGRKRLKKDFNLLRLQKRVGDLKKKLKEYKIYYY
ncbi:MAG: hypothetical protein ACE5HW_04985 [Candidatus Methanofastidiosia archaeon]